MNKHSRFILIELLITLVIAIMIVGLFRSQVGILIKIIIICLLILARLLLITAVRHKLNITKEELKEKWKMKPKN